MGKYDLALADFGKAVELFPASNSGYAKRGEIYRAMGKYDKALAEYDKIVQLYPRQKWGYTGALKLIWQCRSTILRWLSMRRLPSCSR